MLWHYDSKERDHEGGGGKNGMTKEEAGAVLGATYYHNSRHD